MQATAAKAHELHQNQPHIKVIQRDILLDWLGKHPGSLFAGFWNYAQKKGQINIQKLLIWFQKKFDVLFRPPVFIRLLVLIIRSDVDYIIDAQPLCTAAIIRAIKLAEKYTNRSIRYEKLLVDLPTDQALHYFRSIKKLKPKDRKRLYLYTTHPLLDDHESEEAFWQDYTELPSENIIYAEFPLRPSFKDLEGPLLKHESHSLAARIPSLDAWKCICDVLGRGELEYDYCEPYLDLTIPAHSKVTLLMLGSRPAEKATLGYVQEFIRYKQEQNSDVHDVLFAFCRKYHLLSKVCDAAMATDTFPKNLTIIPLTYQDDSLIAPLFARADASITRSGGITSMELLSTMQGQIMVHSEAKASASPTLAELLKGIPVWEKGNARYLQARKQAHIVTPDTLLHTLKVH